MFQDVLRLRPGVDHCSCYIWGKNFIFFSFYLIYFLNCLCLLVGVGFRFISRFYRKPWAPSENSWCVWKSGVSLFWFIHYFTALCYYFNLLTELGFRLMRFICVSWKICFVFTHEINMNMKYSAQIWNISIKRKW